MVSCSSLTKCCHHERDGDEPNEEPTPYPKNIGSPYHYNIPNQDLKKLPGQIIIWMSNGSHYRKTIRSKPVTEMRNESGRAV
jgi:hypothetical protein